MGRANAVGIGLGFLIAIYAVLIGLAGAPAWGLVVIAMVDGFYWAFGRQLFFPGEFDEKSGGPRSREGRSERRANR